jgi:hypothetical protein
MCMQDWRVGRLVTNQKSTSTNLLVTPIAVTANQQRVGIGFSIINATFANDPSVAIIHGSVFVGALTALQPSQLWLLTTHGKLVTEPFALAALSGTPGGVVIEYFMPEEYLAAGVDEFKRSMSKWMPSG